MRHVRRRRRGPSRRRCQGATNLRSGLTPVWPRPIRTQPTGDGGSATSSHTSTSFFSEDNEGNLYVLDLFGTLFRIATDNHTAGDYNADGKVDDSDDDVWKADFGSTSKLDADGNDDTFVDAADYVIWRDNLGNTVGEEIGGPVVPEPAPPCLMCAMAVAAAFGRRR